MSPDVISTHQRRFIATTIATLCARGVAGFCLRVALSFLVSADDTAVAKAVDESRTGRVSQEQRSGAGQG